MNAALRWPDGRRCIALMLVLLMAASAMRLLVPLAAQDRVVAPNAAPLADHVPRAFAGWQLVADDVMQVGTAITPHDVGVSAPYTEQVVRSYRDSAGRTVMLTLAYNDRQRPDTRPHDPDACYPASGFDILSLQPVQLAVMRQPLAARHMLAQRDHRREAVTYWIRIGELFTPSSLASRLYLAKRQLQGDAPDGILVRASMLLGPTESPDAAYAVQARFLADLVAASPPAARRKLVQP